METPVVLKCLGVDPDEVMWELGIEPELFSDPGNLITYTARDRLLRQCVVRTGCQHFGLLVGNRMDLSSLGLVGLLMKTSPTVEAALRSLESYLHLHSQGAVISLKLDVDLAMLTYDAFESGLNAADQTGDGAVAMMLNVMRSLCGPEFRPVEASFAHRKPTDIEPYRKTLSTSLFFDAEHYSLVFSRTWLDKRPPLSDSDLQHLLKDQIDKLDSTNSLDLPNQVRGIMRSALTTGQTTEQQIADLLSMTTRTFARRLEEHGVSFRELIDECRFEISRQLLADTSRSVTEISATLGYSRASSFIRAFRRWSGCTPEQWRQNG